VVEMTDPTMKASSGSGPDEPTVLEPTQAEIDEWATREKRRREAWLSGPSPDERAEYARQVRQRRVSDAFDEGESRVSEGVQLGVRYGREAQLAAEGAMTLFYRWSRRRMAELIRAGREWEEETTLPNRRRRVPMDDEES
jgi:hypothetical protein